MTSSAAPGNDAESSHAPARAGLVLAALILVAAVANLNLAVANVALPDIGKAFDASQTALNLAIASAPDQDVNTDNVQSELTKSFSSAADTTEQHPQYADQIVAAAKESFLQGDDWAYGAGIAAILLGAALIFFLFPKRDAERELLAHYRAQDSAGPAPEAEPAATGGRPTATVG